MDVARHRKMVHRQATPVHQAAGARCRKSAVNCSITRALRRCAITTFSITATPAPALCMIATARAPVWCNLMAWRHGEGTGRRHRILRLRHAVAAAHRLRQRCGTWSRDFVRPAVTSHRRAALPVDFENMLERRPAFDLNITSRAILPADPGAAGGCWAHWRIEFPDLLAVRYLRRARREQCHLANSGRLYFFVLDYRHGPVNFVLNSLAGTSVISLSAVSARTPPPSFRTRRLRRLMPAADCGAVPQRRRDHRRAPGCR